MNRATFRATRRMKPLQVWMPLFGVSLAEPATERDMQRAFDSWRGESTVWLLPELARVVRWQKGSSYHLVGVPSETLNRIDILHVGDNNHVIGVSADRFRNQSVTGLLDVWLNTQQWPYQHASDWLKVSVPHLGDGEILYEERELALRPGPMMPIAQCDESAGSFTAAWPPASSSFRTISPEAESLAEYGPLFRAYDGIVPIARSATRGEAAMCVTVGWPEPLNSLISPSAGWGVLYGQQRMRMIATLSGNDAVGALAQAREQAHKFVFECDISREWAWFWPTIDHGGSEEVVFKAEDLGISAKDWPSLLANPLFKQRLNEKVPVRRVWGPLGLFWALLLELHEEHRTFHACQACGRLVEGKKGKRYCGLKDNSACFSRRRASDRRRLRSRR